MTQQYVWVIEHGCYSDYSVVGVYDLHDKARAVADAINAGDRYSDDATVAKWPMNPASDELAHGLRMFSVVMDIHGNTERCNEVGLCSYDINGGLSVWQRTKAEAWRGKPVNDAIHGNVWARDAQHAVKIANEFRAQQIAAGKMKERT